MPWSLRDGVERRQVILCIVMALAVNSATRAPGQALSPNFLMP